jgi:hypothetical protein
MIESMLGLVLTLACLPGGGPDVTVKDNGDDTVTMSNGIASIVVVKKTGRLNSVTYTYNNDGAPKTSETLSGKGQYYYGGFSLGNGVYEYSLATDPAGNGGDHADVRLLSSTEKNGIMEIHFSMLRGSPGFYSTATMTHRKQDERFEVGAWGGHHPGAADVQLAERGRQTKLIHRDTLQEDRSESARLAARNYRQYRRYAGGVLRRQVHL